jgi:dUTP pyrophosphatase
LKEKYNISGRKKATEILNWSGKRRKTLIISWIADNLHNKFIKCDLSGYLLLKPMFLKIYRLNRNNPTPCYMSSQASGIDLYASLDCEIRIEPGEYRLVSAGIRIALPEGYEGQVRPRSGLAWKHGVTVLNSPGTIDSDYRGEVKVLLINHGKKPFTVKNGMRIAQLVIAEVVRARIVEVDGRGDLEKTAREDGGFGHTGV